MNTNVFAIISDGGKLLGGVMPPAKVSTLKANGFEQVNYSEDFLCALAVDENAIFIAENEKDIECLYDEINIFSLSYHTVELLLNRYKQQ